MLPIQNDPPVHSNKARHDTAGKRGISRPEVAYLCNRDASTRNFLLDLENGSIVHCLAPNQEGM